MLLNCQKQWSKVNFLEWKFCVYFDNSRVTNISEANDSSTKLQNHLKLLKNEYSKLQKSYNDQQKKINELEASNGTSGNESSFNSRLVNIVSSLYGRKTYSDLTIKLKDDRVIPAHKFVLNAR